MPALELKLHSLTLKSFFKEYFISMPLNDSTDGLLWALDFTK